MNFLPLKSTIKLILSIIFLASIVQHALAQCPTDCNTGCTTSTKVGNDAGTYSANTGQTLCIPVGSTITGSITNNGGTIRICGTIEATASLTWNSGTIIIQGTLNRMTKLTINNGTLSICDGGKLNINCNDAVALQVNATGSLTSSGDNVQVVIKNSGGQGINSTSTLTASGSWDVQSTYTGTAASGIYINAGTFTNNTTEKGFVVSSIGIGLEIKGASTFENNGPLSLTSQLGNAIYMANNNLIFTNYNNIVLNANASSVAALNIIASGGKFWNKPTGTIRMQKGGFDLDYDCPIVNDGLIQIDNANLQLTRNVANITNNNTFLIKGQNSLTVSDGSITNNGLIETANLNFAGTGVFTNTCLVKVTNSYTSSGKISGTLQSPYGRFEVVGTSTVSGSFATDKSFVDFCDQDVSSSGFDINNSATIGTNVTYCINQATCAALLPKVESKYDCKIDSLTKTATFTDSSTNAMVTFWQLGNATVSSDKNPVIVYKIGGYYRITESVIDTTTNIIAQTNQLITINDGTKDCEAEFSYMVNPVSFQAEFTNKSLGTNITNYLWDFGDGATDKTPNPSHYYAFDNYYNVCLTAMNSTCKNITCKEIKSGSDVTKENTSFVYVTNTNTNKVYFNDKSNNAISWKWSFGDGTTLTTQHPQHVYADTGLYHVTLEINTAKDASQIYSALVNVHSNINSLRATYISKEKTIPTKGVLPIEFKGVGYGDASEVEWDFGDNTTNSSSMSPIHQFTQDGKYNVCMTVKDSLSNQQNTFCDSVEISVTVIQHSEFNIQHSEFTLYPNPATQSLTVKSNVTSSSAAYRDAELTITNTLGQTVFHQPINSSANQYIDISQFESGVYFVRVVNTVKKLIVNK